MFARTILDQSSGNDDIIFFDFLWHIINTIYFNPLQSDVAYLCPPLKTSEKPKSFLMLSGGIDKEHQAVFS